MENLNTETVGNIKIPVPPQKEQLDILLSINAINRIIDITLTLVSMELSLLNERRTALFSATVTGKIDVRDWTPPTGNPASEDQAS